MNTKKLLACVIACIMLFSAFAFTASAETLYFRPAIEGAYIYGIPAGTTVATVKLAYSGISCQVLDGSGTTIGDTEKVHNGYTVVLNATRYTAIIFADINCDGVANASDYTIVKRVVLGTVKGDSVISEAAGNPVKNNKELDATDYVRVKRHILGTLDMNKPYAETWEISPEEDGWTPWV